MTDCDTSLRGVAVVIPALNEAENLRKLLPRLRGLGLGRVVVGDNGSSDATASVAREHGAEVANAPERGYGAACYAAIEAVGTTSDIIAFVNADLTDDVSLLPALTAPIRRGECDLVVGVRVTPLRQRGSMSIPQRFGDRFATRLIRLSWDFDYYDLGPFRAIRRVAFERLGMRDRAFGWTIEMQIRAVQERLAIQQLPVPYFRSPTPSHIGGTVRGVLRAGRDIISTWYRLR